jgi:hypothetical protein
MKLIVLTASALAAVSLAACGDGDAAPDETTVYRSEEGSVTTSGEGADQTVVIENADGSGAVVGSGAGATVTGPDYARPYPGSRIVSTIDAGADQGGMTVFETDANPDTIVAYYRGRAEEAGLSSGASMTMGDTRQFAFEGENGEGLTVIVTPQDGRSTVNVAWDAAS